MCFAVSFCHNTCVNYLLVWTSNRCISSKHCKQHSWAVWNVQLQWRAICMSICQYVTHLSSIICSFDQCRCMQTASSSGQQALQPRHVQQIRQESARPNNNSCSSCDLQLGGKRHGRENHGASKSPWKTSAPFVSRPAFTGGSTSHKNRLQTWNMSSGQSLSRHRWGPLPSFFTITPWITSMRQWVINFPLCANIQ